MIQVMQLTDEEFKITMMDIFKKRKKKMDKMDKEYRISIMD